MKLQELHYNQIYDAIHRPLTLYADNDGSYLYRYNITPITNNNGEIIEYQCREVRIWEHPTKSVIKKSIIRSVLDESEELNMINDYYKHQIGIKKDTSAVARYKEFLQFTEDLDAMLSIDFEK